MSGHENSGDDWKVGDWAECVKATWAPGLPFDPKLGEKLLVCEIYYGPRYLSGNMALGLKFIGKPRGYAWTARDFRKIISDKEDRKVERHADRPVGEPVA